MQIMDGRLVADTIKQNLKQKIKNFFQQKNQVPGLAILLIGENPASTVYIQQKIKACKEVGIKAELFHQPANIPVDELKTKIQELNRKPAIHAILVQLPLPTGWNTREVLSWVDPRKDPDCLTVENQGLAWTGTPRVLPCTPAGIMKLFEHYQIPLQGKTAIVVGRSQIVGLPMAQLLLKANATVCVCHSHTKNLSPLTRLADVVVVAAGKPGLLGKEDFKKGAVVVDVGIHKNSETSKKLIGDVRFDELKEHVSFATPVPGGVGPMTVAMLLQNTFYLAEQQLQKNI